MNNKENLKHFKEVFYTLSSKTICIYFISISILFELSLFFAAETKIIKVMSVPCLLISFSSLIILLFFSKSNKVRLMPNTMFAVMLLIQTMIISKMNYNLLLLISSVRLLIAIWILFLSVKVVYQKEYHKWRNLVWTVIALILEKCVEAVLIYGFYKGPETNFYDIINYLSAELFLYLFFLFLSKPNEYKVNRSVFKHWFLCIAATSILSLVMIISVVLFAKAPIGIKTFSLVFVYCSLTTAWYINVISKIIRRQSYIPSLNSRDNLYYLEEDFDISNRIKKLLALVEKRARNIKQTIDNTDNPETKEYLKKYLEEVIEDHSILLVLSRHANYKDYDLINDLAEKYEDVEKE